jgi:hypothetical protein
MVELLSLLVLRAFLVRRAERPPGMLVGIAAR